MKRSALRPGKRCSACKGAGCAGCSGRGWVLPVAKTKPPIKAVSSKRAKVNKEYTKLRAETMRGDPRCPVLQPSGAPCGLVATQVHHRMRRNGNMLATETWLAVCSACHEKIEKNGVWARAMGYTCSPHGINGLKPISTVYINDQPNQ